MNNFKELKVWQKAIELSVLVYKTTKSFPPDERFGLISQIDVQYRYLLILLRELEEITKKSLDTFWE